MKALLLSLLLSSSAGVDSTTATAATATAATTTTTTTTTTAAATATTTTTPSHQELLFFNARIALREQRQGDVLKLWLLRNSLRQQGHDSIHDADFRSALWVALGTLGFCPDGVAKDDAGLWPLALHNWVAQVSGKERAPERPSPWGAFQVGRQQRFISLNDVLSAEELRSAMFFRSDCLAPWLALTEVRTPQWIDLNDRLSVALLLRDLLSLSQRTLQPTHIANRAVVDARIFDLDLAIARLQAQRARRDAGVVSQLAQTLGLSPSARADIKDELTHQWPEHSPQADFLRSTLGWSPRAWLDLSPARRLTLFQQAQPLSTDPRQLSTLVLGIIDLLLLRDAGGEIHSWIGFLPVDDGLLFRGERGQRLLELEPASGFRERAVIALHRGVDFLQSGARDDALRSFAWALGHAEESRTNDITHALARRWLSFVLAQYESSASVLATLQALVPRRDFNEVVEDLAWRAALRADIASFERVAASVQTGGALDARIAELRPLAQGKSGVMASQLLVRSQTEPHAVLSFLRVLLDQLQKEDADVRRAQVPTLQLVLEVVRPLLLTKDARAQNRKATALIDQVQAILDGLGQIELLDDASARTMAPSRSPFAGSIRLVPADPLPWPFSPPSTEAPSAFVPLLLQPLEWRADNGALVFGWRLSE